jgi:hypothetical protein
VPSLGGLSIGAVQPGTSSGVSRGVVSIGAVQPLAFAVVSTGGLTTGGQASQTLTFTIFSSGGLAASGSSVASQVFSWLASGGLLASGASSLTAAFSVTASGSATLSGTSAISCIFVANASGGLVASGTSVLTYSLSYVASGGVTASGSSAVSAVYTVQASGSIYAEGQSRVRLFVEGDLPGAVQFAWVAAGLEQDVGPLYYDQAPRGAPVPFAVFNESLNIPHFTMGSGYWEDHRLRFQIIAHQEAEVNQFGALVESRMSSYFAGHCPIPSHGQGSPFSAIFYRRQTIRPQAPWADGKPRAIRIMMMRVRTDKSRSV